MIRVYKYRDIFSLAATVGWISFIYAAFNGFQFWYLGFISCFWFCLGVLNYRHETTIWLLHNRLFRFVKYYIFLITLGFFADYIIGQKLTHLWSYPPYNSFGDWFRLYLLIYPIGGLSVIELVYFLCPLFREKFNLIHKDVTRTLINKLQIITDILLILIVFIYLISKFIHPIIYVKETLVILLLIWTILATVKLKYYLKHWSHWLAILVVTVFSRYFCMKFQMLQFMSGNTNPRRF